VSEIHETSPTFSKRGSPTTGAIKDEGKDEGFRYAHLFQPWVELCAYLREPGSKLPAVLPSDSS